MRNTVLLAFVITAAYSQTVIGEGLSGQELWDYVITNYKTTTTLLSQLLHYLRIYK